MRIIVGYINQYTLCFEWYFSPIIVAVANEVAVCPEGNVETKTRNGINKFTLENFSLKSVSEYSSINSSHFYLTFLIPFLLLQNKKIVLF